jgi:hypothetical protein
MLTYREQYITKKKIYNKLKNNQKGGATDMTNEFMLNYNGVLPNVNANFVFPNNKADNISRTTPIMQIGSDGINGNVFTLTYEDTSKQNELKLILKVTKTLSSGNSYYEYFVGKCINKIKKYFPNFVHTFCYVSVDNNIIADLIANRPYTNYDTFIRDTTFTDVADNTLINIKYIKDGCTNNDKAGVLIQSCGSLKTMDFFKREDIFREINKHFFDINIQIYSMLTALEGSFTHYDLHIDNVMIYDLGKLTKIVYHIGDQMPVERREKITIVTQYMPIIIDYGTAYVKCLDDGILSKFFFDIACETRACNNTGDPMICSGTRNGLFMKTLTTLSPDSKILNIQELIHAERGTYPKIYNKTVDTLFIFALIAHIQDENIGCKKAFLNFCANAVNPWISLFGPPDNDQGKRLFEYQGPSLVEASHQQDVCKINTINDVYEWLKQYYVSPLYTPFKPSESLPKMPTLNIYLARDHEWNYTP